ncbi:MAG: universal stress protein [Haloarculaceae archaeon]
MYDRILLPTDGSEAAERALHVATRVANAHDATLHVVYVADSNQPSQTNLQGEIRDVLVGRGEEIVADAADVARASGVDVVTEVVQGGPSRSILAYVEERGADLVVLGTRGQRDLSEVVLGSVTDHVLRDCPVPVLTVSPDADDVEYPPGDVLVATDGSDGAAAAVDEAASIARETGATLHVLAVDETGPLGLDLPSLSEGDRAELFDDRLDAARDAATRAGAGDLVTAVESGTVRDAIAEYVADNDARLVALGASGRSGIDRRLLGSTAENVVRTSAVPVVTVPPGER